MVKNPAFNYTALGHIHKAQDLNKGNQPPVIYPGSIERVDFGEIADDKYFVIAEIEKGKPTTVEWRKLNGRKFCERYVKIENAELAMAQILSALPSAEEMKDAMLRLTLEYPREWESMIDENEIRRMAQSALEVHIFRNQQTDLRLRLPVDQSINSLTPLDLLEIYWKSIDMGTDERAVMNKLAGQLIEEREPEVQEKQPDISHKKESS